MNEDLELALAYWRTMAPQPKAIVYSNAIEARLKGIETKDMVVDHELANAINRGASIARAKGIEAESAKDSQPTVAPGLKIVTHAQGTKIAFEDRQLCMPHSISRMTDKILKSEILIDENKLTDVCASNVVLKADGIGNQMFDKSRSRGRIDGMVSKAMAVGASKSDKKTRGSYMGRGVRVA